MRFFCFVLALVSAVFALGSAARATPTASLDLRAKVVNLYMNRFIIGADGDVRVILSDGTVVRGQTFAMDLKLNRFIIAGDVQLDGPHVHERGAAFAGYPDLDRSYFLAAEGVPDRWTYYGLDFSDAHKGREQPGDAFYLPDLSSDRPYIISNHAFIVPKVDVKFTNTRQYVIGAYVPTPGYLLNFSANSNYAQNAFAGATLDAGVPYNGSAESISAFHLRYDSYRHAYLSFDQHFVHGRDYAVFSVNPLTQSQRQFNLIGYKRESRYFETRLFVQLSTLSHSFSEPHDASTYANLAVNTAFGKYAVSATADQYNNSLLGGASSDIGTNGLRPAGHPFDGQLSVQSFEDELQIARRLGIPIKFQYRGGVGFIHDGYGIATITGPTFGGVTYPSLWQHYLGITAYTPSIKVANQVSFSVKTDKQRQWYSLPHHVDTTNSSATLSYTPQTVRSPAAYLAYSVLNVGDYYGAQQLAAYPPYADSVTTTFGTYTGLAAFRGIATSRSYVGAIVYAPNPNYAINLQLRRYYDTPAPVPGLGGQPPWQFTGDVRVRAAAHVLIDFTRSYFFNFADNRWSPQFGIQFSP